MKASPEKIRNTVHTACIAGDLVASIIVSISGNDISNSINNSPATKQLVSRLALARISKKLNINK